MENEILWKWELLCGEFEQARQNYLDHFAPLIKQLSNVTPPCAIEAYLVQIRQAETAWNSWIEIQVQMKQLVENDS